MADREWVVDGCTRCPALTESRTQIVNGVGPADAAVLFVGEAPGEQEDTDGEPFVGRSGAILTEALSRAGVGRAAVRITNAVRCRPPENRNPTKDELENCRSYLTAEITAVDPSVVVTLGKVPSEHLLGREVAVTAAAGTTASITVADKQYPVLISLHPAATLYDRSQRDRFDQTISQAADYVDGEGQSRLGDF